MAINAKRVRDFARAIGRLAETDKLDAKVLAHFAAAVRPPLRSLRNEEEEQLTAFLTRPRQVLDMITVEKNRLVTVRALMRSDIQTYIQWLANSLKGLDREKKKKVALTACMRKLLVVLNAVMHSKQPWQVQPI